MIITRKWEMPNSRTFKIKAIQDLILKYIKDDYTVLDPYANEGSIRECLKCKYINNDLDEQYKTDYHLEAQEFLRLFEDNSIDVILNDPPYSPRQISECYTRLGRTVSYKDTSAAWYMESKKEIMRVLKPRRFMYYLWLELKCNR